MSKMKKFNLRGVLDGFRSTVSSGGSSSGSTAKADSVGIEETVWSEHFQIAKVCVINLASFFLFTDDRTIFRFIRYIDTLGRAIRVGVASNCANFLSYQT
jgi:hypothetical protein